MLQPHATHQYDDLIQFNFDSESPQGADTKHKGERAVITIHEKPCHQITVPPSTAPRTAYMLIAPCPTRAALFVPAGAAEAVVFDASDDDAEEDSVRGVAEVVEVRLVEFARDVAEALVVEVLPVLPTCRVRAIRSRKTPRERERERERETHVAEKLALAFPHACVSEKRLVRVDRDQDGTSPCVDVELAAGAHSAAMIAWTAPTSCIVHCCCRQLDTSCWVFAFAHRHCTPGLRTPRHARVFALVTRNSGWGWGWETGVRGAATEVLSYRLLEAVRDAGCKSRQKLLSVDARKGEGEGGREESEVHC